MGSDQRSRRRFEAFARIGCIFFLLGAKAMGSESGLRDEVIESEDLGQPVVWRNFEKGQPADSLIVTHEETGESSRAKEAPKSYWHVRHPGWTQRLLNAVGAPPDLALDPGIKGPCDIHLGLRAVDPGMTLGIRLSSEEEFTVITAPAATRNRHFDFEFHWKVRAPMTRPDGSAEQIVVRALGKPFYLQYIRFVPYVRTQAVHRIPERRVAIMKEEGRHFAFPGVAELLDGDLLVVCREGDGHVCPRGRIVMSRSTDGGRAWSPREVIYDTPSDERDPAILCLKDGTTVVSFNTWDSWRGEAPLREKYAAETALMEKEGWGKYSGSWLMISKDGGRTWSERRKAPVFSPHGPVIGPDDALYWVGARIRDESCFVEIHRTEDLGLTWSRYSDVSYCKPYGKPLTWEYWDEPNLILLPGGAGVCTMRVDSDGYVRQSYSKDGGKTWSWPKRLPVWGFPQQLCRLSDGRILLSYGYRREPGGVRASLSSDGGRSYDLKREIVFRHEGGHFDLGYPYSIQLRNGRVFTAYYYNDKGGDCYIEGASYAP